MTQTLDINVVSSPTGGEISYDRETTIDRIQQAIESILRDHVSPGQISTLKVRLKKPSGAVRRAAPGLKVTNFQFRIAAAGDFTDMARGALIDACKAAVPEIVLARVPADHLCSLVIAFKDSTKADRLPE